jgi:hypothetical protein
MISLPPLLDRVARPEQWVDGGTGQLRKQDRLCLRTDIESASMAVMSSLVFSQRRRPNIARLINHIRSELADLRGAATKQTLNPDHVGDRWQKVLDRRVDNLFGDRLHGLGLFGLRSSATQTADQRQWPMNRCRQLALGRCQFEQRVEAI